MTPPFAKGGGLVVGHFLSKNRSYGLIWPGAEGADRAVRAIGSPGCADGTAVEDEQVSQAGPLLSWDDPTELLLDLILFVAGGQAKAIGHPRDMGVYCNPLGDTEGVTQNDVGSLTPHA